MRLAVLALATVTATASADDWQTSWDGTLYGSVSRSEVRDDSLLNPGNRVAHLAERSAGSELRLNLKAGNDTLRLTARAIAARRQQADDSGSDQAGDAYLSQWQVRLRAAEGWHLAAGREVLNWGAGQFRSPASPFYFDNGRRDPLRELVGMDALKIAWTPDRQNSASLVRVVGSCHGAPRPDAWHDSWLAKFDRRSETWALGLVALKAPELAAFYGAHGQSTLGDALLLYGEVGAGAQPYALQSPADASQPFRLQTATPRRTAALLGASYSFEDGQSLAIEYLHDGHGYTAAQQRAYFQHAASQPELALGRAPRLLGRDYLHLLWQSNLMDERGYWRLMVTHSLTDGGNELAGYGESALNGRLSAYALGVLPQGGPRREFSALLRYSLTLGLKIALP